MLVYNSGGTVTNRISFDKRLCGQEMGGNRLSLFPVRCGSGDTYRTVHRTGRVLHAVGLCLVLQPVEHVLVFGQLYRKFLSGQENNRNRLHIQIQRQKPLCESQ